MKNFSYIALGAAALAAISVFLPWVATSSSVDFMGYSSDFSSGNIAGISFGDGVIGFILSLIGGFMAFKEMKWTFVIGIINALIAVSHIFGWVGYNISAKMSFEDGFASTSIDAKFGLYLFLIASIVFGIISIKFYTKKVR